MCDSNSTQLCSVPKTTLNTKTYCNTNEDKVLRNMYVLKELCLDYVKTSQSNNPPKTEAEFKHFPRCIMHQESVNRNQKFMSAYQKHDYYYLH